MLLLARAHIGRRNGGHRARPSGTGPTRNGGLAPAPRQRNDSGMTADRGAPRPWTASRERAGQRPRTTGIDRPIADNIVRSGQSSFEAPAWPPQLVRPDTAPRAGD